MSTLLLKSNKDLVYMSKDEAVKQTFTVTANSINLKTISTGIDDTEFVVSDITLPLDILKSWSEFESNVLVGLYLSPSNFGKTVTLTEADLVNMSKHTLLQRIKNPFSYKTGIQCELQFFVNNPNGTFEDYTYMLLVPEQNYTIQTDLEYSTLDSSTPINHLQFVDTIQVDKDTAYSDANYTKFTVTSASYVPTVYVDQVVGTLDRARISLTNGVGSFRVLKTSLESGGKTIARLGFKYYESINKFTDS